MTLRFPKNSNIPVELNYKEVSAWVGVNGDKTVGIRLTSENGPQYLDMTVDSAEKLLYALSQAIACVK